MFLQAWRESGATLFTPHPALAVFCASTGGNRRVSVFPSSLFEDLRP
jgi:hypothetical protein